MSQFFTKDYTGAPFELFGTGHLIAIAIIVSASFSLLYFRNAWDEDARRRFRYGLAIYLVIVESSWHIWSIYYGLWNVRENLPLHLCSVFIWLSVIMLIKRNYSIYEMAYFLGIGGAMQAVITPEAGIYGLPHFRAIQTLAAHGGIILAALYMTWVEGFRPTWKSFKRVVIWTNAYMVIVFFINSALSSNYMFIMHKPETPSLIDLLSPWPWYIPELEVLALIICFVLYIPYLIRDMRSSRVSTTSDSIAKS